MRWPSDGAASSSRQACRNSRSEAVGPAPRRSRRRRPGRRRPGGRWRRGGRGSGGSGRSRGRARGASSRRTARARGSRSPTAGRRSRPPSASGASGRARSAPRCGRPRPTPAADQRQVGLLDAARLELRHQRRLRGVVLGDHQQPARVAVEAMDDARPRDAGDAAVLGAAGAGQQGVDQRVGGVARATDGPRGRTACRRSAGRRPRRRRRPGSRAPARSRACRPAGRRAGARRRAARWRSTCSALAVGGEPAVGDQLLDVAPRQAGRVGDDAVDPRRACRRGRAASADAGRRRAPSGIDRVRAVAAQAEHAGNSASRMSSRIGDADRGVGDVERPEPEVADAHVDPVDHVAEAEPVDEVADARRRAAARARSTGTRLRPAGRGTRRSAPRRRATRAPNSERLVAEHPEQRAGVLAVDRGAGSRR